MAKTITPRQRFETQLTALVENFNRHRAHYLSADYNEAEVRAEFIDRFFDALGWDVDNHAGLGPREREVVREKSETSGRSDYQFRLNDRVVFIVEAKAPHVPLDRTDVIMQAKKYAWNSKETSIAAITDFEEFRLYDATVKPDPKHPDVGLIFAHKYTEYLKPKTLDDLWLLSKESVAAGSIDQLLKMSNVKQRERIPVDQSFLDDLTGWREKLAKAVFKIEPDIDPADLNSVVQVFLDRLIFIRFAEDHGILPKYGLEEVVRLWEHSGKQRSLVNDLNALFHEVNDLLNGEIFRFHRCEKTDWDQDAALVAKIIKSLCEGPYRFDVIGVELLGSIYERYLGKTIRVTVTRAVVEDKPEVRKAGGVYYTPKYIVDYIVEQTVGKLLEGKSPAQIAALKILDPACGSGSFLLGAYQKLIDYHTRWKAQHPRQRGRGAPGQARLMLDEAADYEVKLSLEEKAAILRNNIFGVDIDPQAVEITMMSLYIKMLEGERGAMMGRGILPPLRDNIKCGNSLIGLDIRDQEGVTEEDLNRIKPFDWDSEREGFGAIMVNGGFDAVIGNPPYVDIKALPENDVQYIFSKYLCANNRINLFAAFIERSLSIARKSRLRFSMIVPTALFTQDSYLALRRMIVQSFGISNVVRLPNESFGESAGDVKVDTGIIVLQQNEHSRPPIEIIGYSGYERISEIDPAAAQVHGYIQQSSWASTDDLVWSVNTTDSDKVILSKCELNTVVLEECADFSLGLTPYDKYKGHTPSQIANQVFHADYQKDKTYKKLLAGNDVMRYFVHWHGKQWISYGPWLGAPREQRFFTKKRILIKQIIDWTTKRIWATLIDEELYNTQNAFNLIAKSGWAPEYLLGVLNSRLMTFYHRKKYLDEFKMRFQKILIKDCRRFPIRQLNLNDPADKAQYDRMVSLVSRMLDLHKQKQATTSDATRARLEREINITDEKIDALVYELYGLTKEEIKLVENG